MRIMPCIPDFYRYFLERRAGRPCPAAAGASRLQED
jgi:hypothetical protein